MKYKWNGLWGHPNTNKDVVGIIGQELESVAPYAINKMQDRFYPDGPITEIVTINPSCLIFLLVNAAKDLQRQIEELERRG